MAQVDGTGGNDTLYSLTGEFTQDIVALAGDDTVIIRRPDPMRDQQIAVNGGPGTDTLRIQQATQITEMSLTATGGTIRVNNPDQNPQTITYTGIERIVISGVVNSATPLITGDTADEINITGATAAVTVSTGGGNDRIVSAVTFTANGGAGDDTIIGSGQDDVLRGDEGNDRLEGGAGSDTLNGGTGVDVTVGGAGNDFHYVDDAADQVVEAADEGSDRVFAAVTYTLPANTEILFLTGNAAIDGTGNTLDNVITGNAAANVLTGGLGNDSLNGAAGADRMVGGSGNDSFTVDNAGDVVVETGGGGTDTVFSSISLTLGTAVEDLILTGTAAINGTGNELSNRLTGNEAANSLAGGAGHDTLNGRGGADVMAGGLGNDIYHLDQSGDQIIEAAGAGIDTVFSAITYVLPANVDNLQLSGTGNLNGTGNALVNSIVGTNGDNVLDGGGGPDMLYGGLGNDTYIVSELGDQVKEISTSGGTDHVLASVTFRLSANVENLTMTGTGNIHGFGNDIANVIVGNGGHNVLSGGGGNDVLRGGAGNDRYTVDDLGDTIVELAGGGTDIIGASVDYTLPDEVEFLEFVNGFADLRGTGNALNNELYGNDGDNVLDGAAGADTMFGGGGDDIFIADNAGDRAVEYNALSGTDEVRSSATFALASHIENLTLTGTGNVNGFGNDIANLITGNSGNNLLNGFGGADTMIGGAGNDIYVIDDSGDVVQEGAAQGTDTIRTSIDYSLAAGLQIETLETADEFGFAAIALTGNERSNTLRGNGGANLLDGKGGNDVLEGLGGADRFAFTTALDAAGNVDTILGFQLGLDRILLAGAPGQPFAALATGALDPAFFVVGPGATAATHRIVYNNVTGVLLYDADGAGGAAAVQFAVLAPGLALGADSFEVTGPANNAPVIGSGATASVAENSAASSIVYQASASDPDGDAFGFRLSGADAAKLSIDSAGAVRLLAPADFESQQSYSFTVEAFDSSGSAGTRSVTLTITDVPEGNRPPTISSGTTASVAENSPTATTVYQAAASDPDGDSLTYSLTGADASKLTIDSTGAVRLLSSADYETQQSYVFTVRAADPSGAAATRDVTLSITDVADTNRAPTISSGANASVAENSPAATVVYQAAASDPDGDALTYSLTGADAAKLTIDSTGAVRLISPADYETQQSYVFTVRAADPSGAAATRDVTLSITDVFENRAPTITSGTTATVAENSPASTVVYQAAASDPDGDPLTFSLTGADAAKLTIDSTGAVRLISSADYETQQSYVFTVRAADPSGAAATRDVTLSITDVAESLPPYNVAEQEPNDSAGSALALDRSRFSVTGNGNLPDPSLPSATVQGTVSPTSDKDFFSITLNAGELLILDVDGTTTLDALLRVFGPDGVEIAMNDDQVSFDSGSSPHPGVGHNMDSLIKVRAPTTGTYTFSVQSYSDDAGPTSSGGYTVNVSIGPPADQAQIDEENIQALLGGTSWSGSTVTYGFTTSASDYGPGEATDEVATIQPLNAQQRAAATTVLGQVANLTNLGFSLLSSSPGSAQMRFALSEDPDTAHAYYPASGDGGDSWYNSTKYNNPVVGNYQWLTFIHETGHALGLKHGHESPALSPDRDSGEYSVMTYRGYIGAPVDEENGGYRNETWGFPQTMMMYDIAALQRMYGADFTHNAGDSVYSWSATNGSFMVNGAVQWTPGNGAPGSNRVFMTVWDGGGIDTYDLSNYGNSVTIDLRPGEWTTTSQVQRANLGDGHFARGNVANALLYNGDPRSLIENAVGGSGSDVLISNQAANRLTGNGGADSFRLISAADSRPSAADTIVDFVRGSDRIDLSLLDGNDNVAGRQSFAFVGTGAFTAAGQVRYDVVGGSAHVSGDVNGDGLADFQLVLTGVTALDSADFAFGV
jgi:Ca2+-binding RTX toxin-like protein